MTRALWMWLGGMLLCVGLLACSRQPASEQAAEPVATPQPSKVADVPRKEERKVSVAPAPRKEPEVELLPVPAFKDDLDSSTEEERKAVIAGNNAFGFELFRRLADREGNVVISPYSITLAMGMLYAGARGQTAEEIAKVMRFTLPQERYHRALRGVRERLRADKSDKGELVTANALWVQKGLRVLPDYLQLCARDYRSGVGEVNFNGEPEEARKTINRWVAKETRDMIPEAYPPNALDERTRLVLANSLYLNTAWTTPFSPDKTRNKPFRMASGKDILVPTMHVGVLTEYANVDNYQLLRLSYQLGSLEMILLLPGDKDRVQNLQRDLQEKKLAAMLAAASAYRVSLALPRWNTTTDLQLRKILRHMGMETPFEGTADFTGMVKEHPMPHVGGMQHNTQIKVNEEGTRAAAVTYIFVTALVSRIEPPRMVVAVDRPFFFVIRDRKTSLIVMLGRIENPS